MALPVFLSCYDALDTYENGIAYNLRDRGPAGGWIFYINPNYKTDGWRYLEAAPEDQSNSSNWINSGSSPNPQTTENGNTKSIIGSGIANTDAIINQTNHISSAAKLCKDYRGGGYSDWFLPSADDVKEMCWVLHSRMYNGTTGEDNPAYGSNRVGGFNDYYYWSSSEQSSNNAYVCWFNNGEMTTAPKSTTTNLNVHAIRAF